MTACAGAPEIGDDAGVRPDTAFSDNGSRPLPEAWWRDMRSPGMTAAIERALADGPRIEAARARLQRAVYQAERAGAALVPQLDASTQWQRDGGRRVRTSDSFSARLSASWEVDLWGRVAAEREAARLDVKAQSADLRAAAVSLAGAVASAWLDHTEATRVCALQKRALDRAQALSDTVRARYRAGLIQRSEVTRAADRISARRRAVADCRAAAAVARAELTALSGSAHPVAVPEPREIPDLRPLPDLGVPVRLIERRPDVRRARLELAAASARTDAAVAAQYPRLRLSLDLSDTAAAPADLFASWLTGLVAELTAPIVDGGQRALDVRIQGSEAWVRLATYRQAAVEAIRDVERGLATETGRRAALSAARAEAQAARDRLDSAVTRFETGNQTRRRVLEARLEAIAAEVAVVRAHKAAVAARIDLLGAVAGDIPLDEGET